VFPVRVWFAESVEIVGQSVRTMQSVSSRDGTNFQGREK